MRSKTVHYNRQRLSKAAVWWQELNRIFKADCMILITGLHHSYSPHDFCLCNYNINDNTLCMSLMSFSTLSAYSATLLKQINPIDMELNLIRGVRHCENDFKHLSWALQCRTMVTDRGEQSIIFWNTQNITQPRRIAV